MGGLVVKQVIRKADSEQNVRPEAGEFLGKLRGVIFIATPHAGSTLASTLAMFGRMIRISSATQDLIKNDPTLRDLNQWHRAWSTPPGAGKDCSYRIFYEMKPTLGVVTVVTPESADPGLPNSSLIPIDSDHFEICKPHDRHALIYKSILNLLGKELPIKYDASRFDQFCSQLRERRVGKDDQFGGEIHVGSIIGSGVKLPKRFLGHGELIVQCVPASAAMTPARPVDLSKLSQRPDLLDEAQRWTDSCERFPGYRYNHYPAQYRRRNADGLLLWSSNSKDGGDELAGYYIQFHKDGIVEAVDHRIMGQVLHSRIIPGTAVEEAVS